MKTEPIPQSKAKTAYGVLSEVSRLAIEEPKRMRMELWGGRRMNFMYASESMRPACGTVGCIGGWVQILTGCEWFKSGDALGLTEGQTEELFYGDLCKDAKQGTPSHARRVATLISKFQKKYRAQLLAKKV